MNFKEWLRTAKKKNGELLSDASADHYYTGLQTVSKEMLRLGVIDKRLENMNLYELDIANIKILDNPAFLRKDNTGNKMYSNALKRYRCYVYLYSDKNVQEQIEELKINEDDNLNDSEKKNVIKARKGQGEYGDKLFKKYNEGCVITNITTQQVLIACHIKPWSVSNNEERTDINNGLLLSATYQRLFESGLISFDKNGKIKLSNLIDLDNARKLNLSSKNTYDIKYSPEMGKYLDYHNKYIFVK